MLIFLQWLVDDGLILTQRHVGGTVKEEDVLLINLYIYSKTYQ